MTRLSGGKINGLRLEPPTPIPVVVPERKGPWVPRLVETLIEFKQLGLEFEFAWGVALRQHPPRFVELGSGVSDLPGGSSAVEWFHGICRSAWFDLPAADGKPSRMRGLAQALEGGFLPSEDAPAGRSRTRRVKL